MKKITALILTVVMVASLFLLVACNDKENEDNSKPAETVSTVAEKTPLQAYKQALETVNTMTEYDIEIGTGYVVSYSGQTQTAEVKDVYRTDGNTAYYNRLQNGSSYSEYWYTGDVIYTNDIVGKQKKELLRDEFALNYEIKSDDVIFTIKDSAFSGKSFEKKDGAYYVSVEISPEEYYAISGININNNAICTVGFNEKAEIILFKLEAAYTDSYGQLITVTRTINFNKLADVDAIGAPADADTYKFPVKEEALDKSAIDSLNNVTVTDEKTDLVMIDVEGYGKIVVRLYPTVAPKTVENFKTLVSQKYYDGVIFHRVIKDFMVQGGDGQYGNGTGGSGTNIPGEFNANGFKNNLTHQRGVISMARGGNDNNSASSQFFIVHKTSPHLDGQYASFGYVVYGMDVVDAIANVTTDSNDKPITDVKMNSVRFVKLK